jgi:hypothetical protein
MTYLKIGLIHMQTKALGYLEHKIMQYASEDLQQAYNVHYGLTMDDEDYFVPANGWDEYIAYHGRNL